MPKKYRLTDEIMVYEGVKLHRIQHLTSNRLGGWVQYESNLRHDGKCWIHAEAKVYGDATISDDAQVHDDAVVFESANVHGRSRIHDFAKIYGHARVNDSSVWDSARVFGNAICVDSVLHNQAQIYGRAYIKGSRVQDHVQVFGNIDIVGVHRLCGVAKICRQFDYLQIRGFDYPIVLLNTGMATIGCTTRSIQEWLSLEFNGQNEVTVPTHFNRLREFLAPIFKSYYDRYVLKPGPSVV